MRPMGNDTAKPSQSISVSGSQQTQKQKQKNKICTSPQLIPQNKIFHHHKK